MVMICYLKQSGKWCLPVLNELHFADGAYKQPENFLWEVVL